jgi:hypothetical protein
VKHWLDNQNGKFNRDLSLGWRTVVESPASDPARDPFILLIKAIRISNPKSSAGGVKVEPAASGVCAAWARALQVSPKRENSMTDLENKLNHLLEEHQHESGLHMIGGRRRLIDRLVQFFEQDLKKQQETAVPSGSREN